MAAPSENSATVPNSAVSYHITVPTQHPLVPFLPPCLSSSSVDSFFILKISNWYRFLVHSRLQYDNLSPIRGSSWTQTRHWLVLDQPKSELLRSRRRNVNHGAGGPTSNDDDNDDDNGTMAGAVAMIIGTSIGSGMLALPQRTSPAGLLPTSISMITCWCFLVLEALLLVEVNVNLRKRKKKTRDANSPKQRNELEVISIRTMAKETLGEWGGALATLAYIFLGYTSMVAYCSKSGEILLSLAYLPPSSSGCFFTLLFTSLIVVGGTQITDHVNQWLTTFMIGLLLAIEAVALAFGGWAEPVSNGDWGEVPPAIPAMIFALVYHDIILQRKCQTNKDLSDSWQPDSVGGIASLGGHCIGPLFIPPSSPKH